MHRKLCNHAQFSVHIAAGLKFLMIIQDGKIWMQIISRAGWLLKLRINFKNYCVVEKKRRKRRPKANL
jgi:hypothetical protein